MKTGTLDVFTPLKRHDVSGPQKYESGDLLYPGKEELGGGHTPSVLV